MPKAFLNTSQSRFTITRGTRISRIRGLRFALGNTIARINASQIANAGAEYDHFQSKLTASLCCGPASLRFAEGTILNCPTVVKGTRHEY